MFGPDCETCDIDNLTCTSCKDNKDPSTNCKTLLPSASLNCDTNSCCSISENCIDC